MSLLHVHCSINRVQELNTDGVFVGLEVLASQSGEKLWKKLFYR